MEQNLPLVTAIITTYRRSPEIVERAIKSILAQTYKNIEIIVVDDSPVSYENRNQVKQLIESYQNSVKYIQHVENKGACVARNTGLYVAKGEYIAYLDDDDEWMPTKIEEQMKYFTEDDIALVYCNYIIKNDSTGDIEEHWCPYYEGSIYEKILLEGNFVGSTSFPILRKSSLEEIGGFDSLMDSAQDMDVWLRLAQKYKVACVKEALVIYHVHAGDRITTNYKKKINGILRIQEKNKGYIDSNIVAQWRYYIIIAPMYARNGQIKKAFQRWWIAFIKCPYKLYSNLKFLYRIVIEYIRYNTYSNK